MPIDSTHPLYDRYAPDWKQIGITMAGQRAVKAQRHLLLPPSSGMIQDGFPAAGTEGEAAYLAYLERAVYHNIISDAVLALNGIMHRKEATITLPPELEPMRENATSSGESLQLLLKRITEQVLAKGRYGMLVDVPSGKAPNKVIPFIATYNAESIRNWDEGGLDETGRSTLSFLVLDESGAQLTADFKWEDVTRYRVLVLSEDAGESLTLTGAKLGSGTYKTGTYESKGAGESLSLQMDSVALVSPETGGQKLPVIPFVFVNPKDIAACPDAPPFMSLSDLCLTIYKLEADYRQALYLQGQETFVVRTEKKLEEVRLGAGGMLVLEPAGGAAYVGANSSGLPEMREALKNDKAEAADMASKMLDFADTSRQSGEALRIRTASSTANLLSIALACAAALKQALRLAAKWVGADPEEVDVKPNLDFADNPITAQELLQLMQAVAAGLPLSEESIHLYLQRREVTNFDYETELAKIDAQQPIGMTPVKTAAELAMKQDAAAQAAAQADAQVNAETKAAKTKKKKTPEK